MTEKQKQACELRMQGKSMQEIGDALGCTKQHASNLIIEGMRMRPRQNPFGMEKPRYVYPNIEAWINRTEDAVNKIAKLSGRNAQTVVAALKGTRDMRKCMIDAILELTGMTYERAFKRHDEDKEDPMP